MTRRMEHRVRNMMLGGIVAGAVLLTANALAPEWFGGSWW